METAKISVDQAPYSSQRKRLGEGMLYFPRFSQSERRWQPTRSKLDELARHGHCSLPHPGSSALSCMRDRPKPASSIHRDDELSSSFTKNFTGLPASRCKEPGAGQPRIYAMGRSGDTEHGRQRGIQDGSRVGEPSRKAKTEVWARRWQRRMNDFMGGG